MLSRRILFVAPPVGPIGSGAAGGVETHLVHLAPLLCERGHSIAILAPAGSVAAGASVLQTPGSFSQSATSAGRDMPVLQHAGGVLENLWERALLIQNDYDVVIGMSYDWLPFYLTPFFHKPIGHWITIGSSIEAVDRMIEQRWREGRLNVALYTEAQARTFSFLELPRVHYLYGAVDAEMFAFNPFPGEGLCWAGRISPEKGLEDAIAAARLTGRPLDICGKIQDDDYWRASRSEGGSLTYRGFLGPAELRECYAKARVTLATPRWIEAFGNTVIESMACGTPVVTWDEGGPAEIIENGRNGILVPRREGNAGLAAGVTAAMALDRRAVRQRALEFSFDRMADRLENWMDAVIG